jgi:hypothetical protein
MFVEDYIDEWIIVQAICLWRAPFQSSFLSSFPPSTPPTTNHSSKIQLSPREDRMVGLVVCVGWCEENNVSKREVAQEPFDFYFIDEPTWRCQQNPFIGALGIQEPVILGWCSCWIPELQKENILFNNPETTKREPGWAPVERINTHAISSQH